jgi:hypothetical protein
MVMIIRMSYPCALVYSFEKASLIQNLLLLLTATEFSLGGSSPYTSTAKTDKNEYA